MSDQEIKFTEQDLHFMEMAAKLAEENVLRGGGPFGAVIVKDGEIVATGANSVTLTNDPTAHAEVNAIRKACKENNTFNLAGCVIYSSCEPCPMCLSALYWAGVSRIYYGNTQADADHINFSDQFIYQELDKPKVDRALPCIHMPNPFTIKAFEMWEQKEDKVEY